MSDSLWPHEPQHTRPPCPLPTPGVHPNPCPSSRWCHPTISPSVVPFSSCPQSFAASVFSNESALHIHRVRRMFINRTYACEIFFGQQWLFEYHRLLLKMMSLYFKLDNKIKQCIIFSLAMATICKIYMWQRLLNVCQYPFLSIPSSF